MNTLIGQEKSLRKKVIQAAVRYYRDYYRKDQKAFTPGDHIPYAGRVFDEKEITALINSSLDFWLTSGRFSHKFEKEFAAFLGVKH